MGYDRLCGVLVAQQKVVPDERFADQVSGEHGRRVGFESHRICLLPYKSILGVSQRGRRSVVSADAKLQQLDCLLGLPLRVPLYGIISDRSE
jgi:hypothetical protein